MKAVASLPVSSRMGTLGSIIVLHIGLLYAIKSGGPHPIPQPVQAKEVVATFIVPEPARVPAPPPPPQSAPKKPVPAIAKAPARPKPAKPMQETAPSPQAISEPPVTPAPVEPVAPPVAIAPPVAVAPSAPAAPPAPPAPPQPRTVTSGIEYLQPPQPDYPAVSRRMGEEGKAVLRILVNDKGRPERIEVQKSSGSTRLDEAARQAVSRAVFKPFIEDGKPVAAYAIVPIKFQLNS